MVQEHAADARPTLHPLATLERGETADAWWNAAQWEMLATGYMHNYMRMYWCKRLIEWTKDPRQAFQVSVRVKEGKIGLRLRFWSGRPQTGTQTLSRGGGIAIAMHEATRSRNQG